jgi:hypothetical protein
LLLRSDAALKTLRATVDSLTQEREDQRGVIASLQHALDDLDRGLTQVDPQTLADLEASALAQGHSRLVCGWWVVFLARWIW